LTKICVSVICYCSCTSVHCTDATVFWVVIC